MRSQRIVGSGIVLGTCFILSLLATGVLRHSESVQGAGVRLLWTDVALLAVYGLSGIVVWKQQSSDAITASKIGAQIGLMVGAVAIANHLIEAFVPTRMFILVIGPVWLTLALLGTTGAATWGQTKSLVLTALGGCCCAIVATLVTLGFAITFNLLSAARIDWQLHEAFAASGMTDRAAFRVRNILESSSEILVRMPLLAACFACGGAAIQAWMSRSRRASVAAVGIATPFVFATGAAALWHANAIERAARPAFVLSGVSLSGLALCAVYPLWLALHGLVRR